LKLNDVKNNFIEFILLYIQKYILKRTVSEY